MSRLPFGQHTSSSNARYMSEPHFTSNVVMQKYYYPVQIESSAVSNAQMAYPMKLALPDADSLNLSSRTRHAGMMTSL